MSSQRGNASRTRAQKYKNRHAFRNDMHDKTPQQTMLNSLHISDVCQHCKGVLEWKIKYKKYKPLTQPKVCTRCQQRNIRKAYHVLCRDCARSAKVCAKCLKSAEEVEIEPEPPSQEEQIKLRAEMNRLMKSLPERKRRAFLRYMEKGKTIEDSFQKELKPNEDSIEKDEESYDDDDDEETNGDNDEEETKDKSTYIQYTREELLQKFEELKQSCKNQNELDVDLYSDADDSEYATSDTE